MKYLFLFLIVILGCSKSEVIIEELDIVEELPVIDTSNIWTGRYHGDLYLWLPDRDTIITTAYREIYRNDKGRLVIRWWSFPDTVSITKDKDTLHYTMTYDNTNTSCGIQRAVYHYISKAYMVDNYLVESGTVDYEFYYYGKLVKQLNGVWYSRARWVDRLTPMKPRNR